ncbi:PfkB family carbohydrate kinase [Gephyromycinifex aptenodytis]|uniref:PfkB family carbohydrate kinase n=1 Tax=Gephyromycinifex aptenodytis TaxID=2716227 RepID=UPI0014451BA1|nr:PfkB family carbohydrate kinase [Gephyromycinifex aptenodytis]
MPRLIHTGSVIVDVVMTIDRLPDPGGDTVASSSELVAGGALNTMVAARRDGLDVLYAGLTGTGTFASIIQAALGANRLDSLLPPVPDLDSGYCVALVQGDGERTFITHLGAEGQFGYEHLAAIPLTAGDLVFVSGYSLATKSNAEGLARWLGDIPEDNIVLVDPSPLVSELPCGLYRPLFDRADILSCNAREARILTGVESLEDGARELARRVRPGAAAVVRAGAHATIIARTRDEATTLTHVPTFPVDAVDTNGAGDAHAGVLLSGLARGLSLEEAVLRANAAASIAVTRTGPTSAPTAEETDRLLAAQT